MRGSIATVLLVAGLAGCGGGESAPAPEPRETAAPAAGQRAAVRLRVVARGLDSPLHVAAAPGEPSRLYVVEQGGRIEVLERGRLRAQPFLDIAGQVRAGGEQGLLSVAFHPQYAKNRRFYVNFTDRAGSTRVVEYRSNGRRALTGTARLLLRVPQPYANHNGGQLAFGPDGRLYVGMGDGGSGGDPQNNAQRPGTLLGKLVSINVATKGARIEAFGLRNPWRFSFDRANGDLYIGDVGQNAWEEVDYLPRRSPGIENYGWSRFEGRARYSDRSLTRGRYVAPIAVYANGSGGCSITGGFVYRGKTLGAAARGRYFYGDFCSGNVWSLKVVKGKATAQRREPFRVESLASFGEDLSGELYAVSLGGTVYRLAR